MNKGLLEFSIGNTIKLEQDIEDVSYNLIPKRLGLYLKECIPDFDTKFISGSVIQSSEKMDLEQLQTPIKLLINTAKVNNVRYINKFFESLNSKLEDQGIYVGCVETYNAYQHKHWISRFKLISKIYFFLVFIMKRVLPKIRGVNKLYFFLTKGRGRMVTKAEVLGRLVSCGFEIKNYRTIDGLLHFVVMKSRMPYYDESPSYGPLYSMPRIGKDGREIRVYKLRTMHPYAEYLHDYILSQNGYASTGKPANDFRVAPWGKFFRKYWIDEMPQIINVLKGEMKLVGVRPVGRRYYEDIPEEYRSIRFKYKPGCIPPYVSLGMSGDVENVLKAEQIYLNEYKDNPIITDIKYFFMAIFNILFRGKRSA